LSAEEAAMFMKVAAMSIFTVLLTGCAAAPVTSPAAGATDALSSTTTPAPTVSAASATAVLPSPTAAISTAIDGTIVFARGGDLYTLGRDGEKRLTMTDAGEGSPEWSPKGDAVIFTSDRDGQTDLYTITADGSHVKRLTDTPGEEGAAGWSPDGKRVAFVTFADPGGGAVWVMDADGSRLTKIYADATAFIGFQEWSRDGRILLGIDKAGGGELDVYAIGPDGKQLSAIVQGPGDDSGGRMSPDGSKLAFWSDNGPGAEGPGIYVSGPDGGHPTAVYRDTLGLDTASLAWSPDNREIAWAGKFEGGAASAIYVQAIQSGERRQLTGELPAPTRIDWK
jgi:Tol biopolymer transport system component